MSTAGIIGAPDDERIVDFDKLDDGVQELIQAAIKVRTNSYCPYSNFPVGSALRLANGQIITGCNVENASFGATICAERNAISHAISIGQRDFAAVAVVAFQERTFTAPCGLCRQSLAEFGRPEMRVYLAKPAACRVMCTTLGELLPHAFEPTFLRDSNASKVTVDAANRNSMM